MCTSGPHDNLVRKHLHEATGILIQFLSLVLNISESIKCVLVCLEPTPINKIAQGSDSSKTWYFCTFTCQNKITKVLGELFLK